MKGKLRFLGTGGSCGVPLIGCSCVVCRSQDPLNQRFRPSVLFQIHKKQFLVDVGPDFRMQALRHGIDHLDGVLLTHAHQDHVAGFDDLRPIYFNRQSPLPILLSSETAKDIQLRFHYFFQPSQGQENFQSRFVLQILPHQHGEVVFEEIPIRYVTYEQGGMSVNGYQIGNLAYISDIRQFNPTIFEQLKGIKYLIISALRFTSSPLHFSVDEAIDFARQLNAEHVWFTHISHELDHHNTNAYLPANIRLAYDGLEIDFEVP